MQTESYCAVTCKCSQKKSIVFSTLDKSDGVFNSLTKNLSEVSKDGLTFQMLVYVLVYLYQEPIQKTFVKIAFQSLSWFSRTFRTC